MWVFIQTEKKTKRICIHNSACCHLQCPSPSPYRAKNKTNRKGPMERSLYISNSKNTFIFNMIYSLYYRYTVVSENIKTDLQ